LPVINGAVRIVSVVSTEIRRYKTPPAANRDYPAAEIGQSRVASVLFGGDAPSLMDPQSMAALSNERRAACHENATPPPVTNRRMLVKGGAGNFSERQAAR
jgi:hypothetical protein